jgi:hypothetical protein
MRVKTILLFYSLFISYGIAQTIESTHPLSLSNGEPMAPITLAVQFNDTYVFKSTNKRDIYFGKNLNNLNKLDFRDEFFKVFDSSAVKSEAESIHKVKDWRENLFFSNLHFLRIGPDIGIAADFVIESYQYEYMLPYHKVFILLFDSTTFRSKKILFIDLPKTEPQPIIRNVLNTPNTALNPYIYVDVEYEEETSLPVFIGLSAPNTPVISFPVDFQLPPNSLRSGYIGRKLNYSVLINNEVRHLYSNGFEIIDMDKKEILFIGPESSEILSPILFVQNHPCVLVADIDFKQMRAVNYRFLSVMDGSLIKIADYKQLPSHYIQNLTGLSDYSSEIQSGFRNIDGKPHLVRFTP